MGSYFNLRGDTFSSGNNGGFISSICTFSAALSSAVPQLRFAAMTPEPLSSSVRRTP